ncbi:G-protein coupled receptor 157-like [Ostrea edulis]|uniref:G-protein coupled receptor 157-like n=1 Tax=Ostrea edulis TaxID=37623 RepID=UPI0024AF0543|nr:G-protein coupled receptor 157-like [Ostrea edulis]
MHCLLRATIITFVSSGLSVISGILIFIEYSLNLHHDRLATMFVFMTIGDFMYAVGYIVGDMRYYDLYEEIDNVTSTNCSIVSDDASNDLLCKGQSFVTTYGSLVSFAWTCNLLITLYLYYRGHDRPSRLREGILHFVGWILPGIIVISAVSAGALGEDSAEYSGPWCWVRDFPSKGERILWMLFAGKFWEILTYIITFVMFVLCMKLTSCGRKEGARFPEDVTNQRRFVRMEDNEDVDDQSQNREDQKHYEDQSLMMWRFCFAWIILVVTRCFGTTRFFLYVFDVQVSDKANEWLLNLQSFGDGSLAFVNFVFYLITNPAVVRKYWKQIRARSGNDEMSNNENLNVNE